MDDINFCLTGVSRIGFELEGGRTQQKLRKELREAPDRPGYSVIFLAA